MPTRKLLSEVHRIRMAEIPEMEVRRLAYYYTLSANSRIWHWRCTTA